MIIGPYQPRRARILCGTGETTGVHHTSYEREAFREERRKVHSGTWLLLRYSSRAWVYSATFFGTIMRMIKT